MHYIIFSDTYSTVIKLSHPSSCYHFSSKKPDFLVKLSCFYFGHWLLFPSFFGLVLVSEHFKRNVSLSWLST